MLGIVGHSGSGKSTTVNLIMRFYDTQEGVITVDNTDIRHIKKNCLRRQVGLVAQDPFLFRGTIADNIAYGNPDVAAESILSAALAANAHMFITRIHDGYDTRLGEHGSGLSGGERQRVAIARALLHNPRVLILDEATSSVDAIAEREIQRALEALSQGRTTIAIAHRLSTLRNCDRILVFEEGVIREHGSHDELVALGGIYKKLVDIQTQLNSHAASADDLADLKSLESAEARKPSARTVPSDRGRPDVPHVRYLKPEHLRVRSMPSGGMHVEYKDEAHEHVRAYRCFPTSRPSEFIALWIGASALEHQEIGVVRRLHELDAESLNAVELELSKRYFIHYIKRILDIKEEMGFLMWEVETDKGRMEFLMKRWERSAVVEGPGNGRIVLDLDMNRYEIEDLDLLDDESREAFLKYIYW
jgi:ABC-type multidrug transport system ATPase subunit